MECIKLEVIGKGGVAWNLREKTLIINSFSYLLAFFCSRLFYQYSIVTVILSDYNLYLPNLSFALFFILILLC